MPMYKQKLLYNREVLYNTSNKVVLSIPVTEKIIDRYKLLFDRYNNQAVNISRLQVWDGKPILDDEICVTDFDGRYHICDIKWLYVVEDKNITNKVIYPTPSWVLYEPKIKPADTKKWENYYAATREELYTTNHTIVLSMTPYDRDNIIDRYKPLLKQCDNNQKIRMSTLAVWDGKPIDNEEIVIVSCERFYICRIDWLYIINH